VTREPIEYNLAVLASRIVVVVVVAVVVVVVVVVAVTVNVAVTVTATAVTRPIRTAPAVCIRYRCMVPRTATRTTIVTVLVVTAAVAGAVQGKNGTNTVRSTRRSANL
jgi:hypothetical protein